MVDAIVTAVVIVCVGRFEYAWAMLVILILICVRSIVRKNKRG